MKDYYLLISIINMSKMNKTMKKYYKSRNNIFKIINCLNLFKYSKKYKWK